MKTGVIDLVIEYQVDVLDKLISNNEIDLKHTLTGTKKNFHGDFKKFTDLKQKLDKKTKFDKITDFIFSEEIINQSTVPFSISEDFIEEVKHIESLFYRITDRAASLPISVHERRLFYLILLNYFNYIILKNELELIIVFDTPHSFASIIYFELAKFHKLKLINLEYHFFEDMSNITDQYEFPKVPLEFLRNNSLNEIKGELPELIKEKLITKNIYVSNYKEKEKRKIKRKSSKFNLLVELTKRKMINLVLGVFPSLSKQGILHFTSLNNISSVFIYRIKINTLVNKLYRLNNYYNQIATKPDFTANYIFFGLHMQPEKTSQPLGRESDNQFYPIFLLSKNIPKDWVIYVKEHPNQYNLKKISNRNYRSKNFYNAILKLPNVQFVPFNTSADQLINNAIAISTLSGTIGWEGLTKGKPVIAFGNPYYLGCRSVFQLRNKEEVSYFFNKVRDLSSEDVEKDFYRYLIYYYQKNYFTKGANWELKIAVSKRHRDWHIDNITKSISNYISKM